MSDKPPARFAQFKARAQQLIESPSDVQRLLGDAVRKMSRSGGEPFAQVAEQFRLAVALLRAWLAGDYRQVSNKTVVVLIAALLYFVVPFDVVPDFLFGWGFVDDIAVMTYVFGQLREEMAAFAQWQQGRVSETEGLDPDKPGSDRTDDDNTR